MPIPAGDRGWQDILVWENKALSANQFDVSRWIPVRRANRLLVSGVWLYAGAAVTLNFAVFGSEDGENEAQISTWNVNQLGAWWASSISPIDHEFVRIKVQNGNTDSCLSAVFARTLLA